MKEDQRLPSLEPQDSYAFGPFRLEAGKRRLWRGHDPVALTPKAFDTLLALVAHAGRVVDKDDLLKMVWPDTFVAEETLTQNISTIRKALGDTSDHPEYIATFPRRGYQFIGVLTIADQKPTQSPALLATSQDAPSHDRLRPARLNQRERLLIGVASVATVVSVVLGLAYYLRPTRIAMPLGNQWQINPPTGTTLLSSAVLSPDGRSVAFVTTDHAGRSVLWVQGLMSLEPQPLPGTEDAREPFWSPDGGKIAFSAQTKLKWIGLKDKVPTTLGEIEWATRGGAWSPSGVIVYPITNRGPLYQIKAEGGTFEPVTRLEGSERVHVWPYFLPDGRHFLFRAVGFNSEQSGTYVGSLDSNERTRVLDGTSSAAIYAPPGYLLFVREGALLAQGFEPSRRVLKGPTFVVAPNVGVPSVDHGGTFSAAADVVSYVSRSAHDQLVWFDRGGRRVAVLDGSIDLNSPSLSPDDTQVLAAKLKLEMGNQIWLTNTAGGTPTLFDTGKQVAGLPLWSPDGKSVVFASNKDLYQSPANGGRADLLMKAPKELLAPHDWSNAGQIIFMTRNEKTGMDLWWLSLRDRHAEPFLQTTANELQGQVSPDCHSLAYTSDASDTFEVYVQSFPEPGWKKKISLNGGAQPKWRRDGRELFFLSSDNTLMSVDVRPGSPPDFDTPRVLFRVDLNETLIFRRNHYAVNHDGSRFLFSAPIAPQPPITIRVNWTAAARP